MVDSLLETGRRTVPMSVDQNVSFYEEQLQLFSAVLANARLAIEASQMQLESQRSEIENLRNRIRELRDTFSLTVEYAVHRKLGAIDWTIRILEGVLSELLRIRWANSTAHCRLEECAGTTRTPSERRSLLRAMRIR